MRNRVGMNKRWSTHERFSTVYIEIFSFWLCVSCNMLWLWWWPSAWSSVFCFFSGAVSRICTYMHQRTRRTIWIDAKLYLEINGCSEDPDSFQRLLCWWLAFDCKNPKRKSFHFWFHHSVWFANIEWVVCEVCILIINNLFQPIFGCENSHTFEQITAH